MFYNSIDILPILPLVTQKVAVFEHVRGQRDSDAVGLDGMHEVIP